MSCVDIEAYSQRMLSPYSAQLQIAEAGPARALSIDGINWELQYAPSLADSADRRPARPQYLRIAVIQGQAGLRTLVPPGLDPGVVSRYVDDLAAFVADAGLPFPAVDHYEFWLLDGNDGSPLALIQSCRDQAMMPTFPQHAEWAALPASMMAVAPTEDETDVYVAPVNYRVERLVAERAGQRPRARWFNRLRHTDVEFPPCLVSERWDDPQAAALCDRYVARQAPRLLMLHGLSRTDRQRLELAAKDNALEVDRFYPLYPAVADEELMSAIRVEASLRKATAEQRR
jgi:hypothetical protein